MSKLADEPTAADLSLFVETLRGLELYDEIRQLCKKRGILSPKDLRGTSREWHISLARGEAMKLVTEKLGWSSLAVGRLFGRSSSTVLHLTGRTKTSRARQVLG